MTQRGVGPPGASRPTAANVMLGIARLARFDAAGLAQFGATREAFLASLAPLIAFPLVGVGLMLIGGEGFSALVELIATLCALLAPAVLSHALAVAWQREAAWLRYATAFNWCQWAIPIAATLLLMVLGALLAMGLPNRAAGVIAVVGLVGYGLALHWFLARHGLRLSALRAALLVVAVNLGTALLVLLPRLVVLATGWGEA